MVINPHHTSKHKLSYVELPGHCRLSGCGVRGLPGFGNGIAPAKMLLADLAQALAFSSQAHWRDVGPSDRDNSQTPVGHCSQESTISPAISTQ